MVMLFPAVTTTTATPVSQKKHRVKNSQSRLGGSIDNKISRVQTIRPLTLRNKIFLNSLPGFNTE